MPIALECTSCEAKLKVADNLAGRSIKCPKCGNVTKVPAAGGAPAAPAAKKPAPQPAKALATAAKKPKPVEEDEDLEEDLDDANVKSNRPVKKSRRDEDDEDEDDENVRSVAGAKKKSKRDEEDEDEDEPKVKSASKKSKSSKSDEEDEDDENVKSAPKKSKGSKEERARRSLAQCDVPDEMMEQAEGELGQGERLVWVGQPVPKIMVMRSLGASIGAAFISIIFLVVSFTMIIPEKNTPMIMKLAFPGIAGVILLGAASVPFLAKMRARKTLYAITSRRAVVWNCNWVGMVSLTNYTPEQLQNMWRRNSWFMSDQGGGDLIFKSVTVITTTHHYGRRGGYRGSSTSSTTYYYGFLAILDAAEVEVLLRETLIDPFKSKRKKKDDDDEDDD